MRAMGIGVIKNSNGGDGLILDEGVYNRNRNFRLFMSSKFGKNKTLTLSESCCFYGIDNHRDQYYIFLDSHPSDYRVFIDSLVTPHDYKNYELYKFESLTLPEKKKNGKSCKLSKIFLF